MARTPAPTSTLVLLAGLAVSGSAACDIPTEVPRWDTEWDVVVVSRTISTADLLPDEMRVTEEGFVLDSFESDGQVRLGDVCEFCTCFDGPIPPVEIGAHDWPMRLPNRVLSVDLLRGRADVVIHNEVGFDVLDDGAGGHGFLQVDLTDSWTDEVLSSVLLDDPFPPGDSLLIRLDLPEVQLSPRIVARVSGRTPGSGCDSVSLEPESGFRTTVRLTDVVSSGALVLLSESDLALPSRDYGLPSWVRDRLRPGDAEVVLDVLVESSLPTAVELDLSAAGSDPELFTDGAALFTPLLLPAAEDGSTVVQRREYLITLGALADAEGLWVASRAVVPEPVVELDGDEGVTYTVRLRARIPTR